MKKIVIVVSIALIVLTGLLVLPLSPAKVSSQNATYLRVHIRANSNSEQDQSVKLEIKELVVSFLTPKLENVAGLEQAKDVVDDNLEEISALASDYLEKKGFSYTAKAKLNNEYFPTRSYEEITLEDGYYDALILELGSAQGNNWWCVVYPPLCFTQTNENEVVYKSIIQEILQKRRDK